jgi:hypothetical protein
VPGDSEQPGSSLAGRASAAGTARKVRFPPKPSILWVSDSPTFPSAYGRVTHEVLSRLGHRGYSVCCLGVGYDGWPYDTARFRYPILPSPGGFPTAEWLARAISYSSP